MLKYDIYSDKFGIAIRTSRLELTSGGFCAHYNAIRRHDGDNRYPRIKGNVREKQRKGGPHSCCSCFILGVMEGIISP